MSKYLLEVCCGSVEDVLQAKRGGADRVELNSCLFHGGLTPSIGELITAKALCDLPVMVSMVKSWIRKEYAVQPKVLATMAGAFLYLVKKKDLILYLRIRHSLLGRLINMPGKAGRDFAVRGYHLTQRFFGFN